MLYCINMLTSHMEHVVRTPGACSSNTCIILPEHPEHMVFQKTTRRVPRRQMAAPRLGSGRLPCVRTACTWLPE